MLEYKDYFATAKRSRSVQELSPGCSFTPPASESSQTKAIRVGMASASLLFDEAAATAGSPEVSLRHQRLPLSCASGRGATAKNKNTLNKKFTSPRLRPGEKHKTQKHKWTAVYLRPKTKHQRTVGSKSFSEFLQLRCITP